MLPTTEFLGLPLICGIGRSAVGLVRCSRDGSITEDVIDEYRQMAAGELPLINVEHTYVHPRGKADPHQLAIDCDDRTAGHRRLVHAIHTAGPHSKVALQIAHAGIFGQPDEGVQARRLAEIISPMVEKGLAGKDLPAWTYDELANEVVPAFGHAARRAREAGYDAIQIHMAHGYLLSSMMSPLFNTREDAYGKDRMLLPLQVARAVVEAAEDVPVFVKIGADNIEGGNTAEDVAKNLIRLADVGIKGAEISCGANLTAPALSTIRRGKDCTPGYNMKDYRTVRAILDDAGLKNFELAVVGGFRTVTDIEDALAEERGPKVVYLARPFIREPNLVAKFRSGEAVKAACINCNGCITRYMQDKPVYCVFNLPK